MSTPAAVRRLFFQRRQIQLGLFRASAMATDHHHAINKGGHQFNFPGGSFLESKGGSLLPSATSLWERGRSNSLRPAWEAGGSPNWLSAEPSCVTAINCVPPV